MRVNIMLSVGEYGEYRVTTGGRSQETWNGERHGLYGFVAYLQDRSCRYWDQVDASIVEDWWAWLSIQSLGDATRQTRLAQLRGFLTWAKAKGHIAGDPSALIHFAAPAQAPRGRLTASQLVCLLDLSTYPRDRGVIAVASNLALRGGEIGRLRVGDVRLDDGELLVRVDKTKQIDLMPISLDLERELVAWLDHYRAVCGAVHRGAFLFPAMHVSPAARTITYRPDSKLARPWDVAQRVLTRALDTELIDPAVWAAETDEGEDPVLKGQEGIHTIRRSVARIYFDKVAAEESFDGALLATMSLLHHTRPETTLKYVGRDRAIQARDRRLKGQPFLTAIAEEQKPLIGGVRPLRVVS